MEAALLACRLLLVRVFVSAGGTPIGVLVEDGRISSHVADGADELFELIHRGSTQLRRRITVPAG